MLLGRHRRFCAWQRLRPRSAASPRSWRCSIASAADVPGRSPAAWAPVGNRGVSMGSASYVRLFTDEHGESHFEEIDVALMPVDFAPPAAPLNVGTLFSAARCSFLHVPVDWHGQILHPSPQRQLLCNLRGEFEVTSSDGAVRRFPAGSVLLLEDTTGKGHSTRVTSDDDVLLIAVTLAD